MPRRYQPRKPNRRRVFRANQPRAEDEDNRKRRTVPQKIRSTAQWRKVRKMVIDRAPICQWCGKRPAEHGHHIRPVAEVPEKAMDEANILAVCAECHEKIESATRRGIDIIGLRRELEGQ